MTNLSKLTEQVSPNGATAKVLSIVYVLWVLVLLCIVPNLYSAGNKAQNVHGFWLNSILSVIAILIPAFIGTLQGNEYGVEMLRKRGQSLTKTLDERQLDTRRRIFEKSYAILATLTFIAAFTFPNWIFGKLTTEGSFIIAFNIAIFVLALPSFVAVWDKNPLNNPKD